MKVTIVYDNTVVRKDLISDWGFACYIETNNKKILFDVGANGAILLQNMNRLNINPLDVDTIFISHNHFDHIGGLSEFLNINNQVTLYIPNSFRGVRNAKKVQHIQEARKLDHHVFTTGELDGIEQALAIQTERGLVLIVGCSHPKMKDILASASQFGEVYAVIGGMHGFTEFDLFKGLDVICPTHCTQHIDKLKVLYPHQYTEGGAGKMIEL